jgi:hypothetical protein
MSENNSMDSSLTEETIIGVHKSDQEQVADASMSSTTNRRTQSPTRRKLTRRSFPAAPFEEALELPLAIHKFASGHRILRLRLFELLQRSPESGLSRQLITNSSRYGLITGGYTAE